MIGRNDPCPCESGRKYKKCCESRQDASFEKVLESELLTLQLEIMRFAFNKYAGELDSVANKYVQRFDLDQEKREAYQEIVHLWYMFTAVRESGQTIVQEFVKANGNKFPRQQVKEWAESWQTAQPSVYKVINVRGAQYTMEDCFTYEKIKVRFIGREEGLSKNELVVGMFVPFQDSHVVFMSSFERGTLEAIRIEEKLQVLLEKESLSKEQVCTRFPTIAGHVIEFELSEADVQELPVQNEAQEKVLELFMKAAKKRKYPERFQEFAHMLWSVYCMKESPAIRNEPNYAAALIYFLDVQFMQEQVETQKALSEEFGISPGSVSATYRKLDEVLQPVIQTFQQDIEAALQ